MDGQQGGLFLVDLAVAQEAGQFGVHGEHVRAAAEDGVVDLVGLALADQVLDGGIHAHDLEDGVQLAFLGQDQALGDHGAEHHGQLGADLVLLVGREGVDHTVDGLGGTQRMQGGQQQVAGFCRGDGGGDRLDIAHFTEHDHVRRLAQGRAQGAGEGGGVAGNFPLADQALLVGMQVFDRVLDGDDMAAAGPVDLVYQAGQGRTFTVAGGTGDQDHTAAEIRQLHDHVRDIAVFRVRNAEGDHTAGHGQGAALPVGVAAETGQVADREGEVVVAFLLQGLAGSAGQLVRAVDQHGDIRRQGAVLGNRDHLAAGFGHNRGTGHDKHVGTFMLQCFSQDLVKLLNHPGIPPHLRLMPSGTVPQRCGTPIPSALLPREPAAGPNRSGPACRGNPAR